MNAFPAGLPAAVVATAMGLGGVAFTLDAACGSSLYAIKLAVDELRSGRADAMISGGVSRPDALYTQMGFSQLRRSRPEASAAPLDHRGDGLIVGEGAGMFVLKRLDDALSHGDHIYGIVAGIGLSNDVHGDLLAPSSEGQLRAMRRAYEQAGWGPVDVDLIECHATGNPSRRCRRGPEPQVALGSDRLEGRAMRHRLDQGEHRSCAHGGRRGRVAQGPAGPEAWRVPADGELRTARARPGIGA